MASMLHGRNNENVLHQNEHFLPQNLYWPFFPVMRILGDQPTNHYQTSSVNILFQETRKCIFYRVICEIQKITTRSSFQNRLSLLSWKLQS